MSSMFDNYSSQNLNVYQDSCCLMTQFEASSSYVKDLYDKKHRFYGVEAKYQMPFSLYLHLIEMTNQSIDQFISECSIELNICTIPYKKAILSKVFVGKNVFNKDTQDIKVDITQEEAQQLNQETYSLIVKLFHTTGTYIIHSEHDGVLVIR